MDNDGTIKLPRVESNFDLDSRPLAKPDPVSKYYLRWSEVRSLNSEMFNTAETTTASVEITGMRRVFDVGNPKKIASLRCSTTARTSRR